MTTIRRIAEATEAELHALAGLLIDCVDGGASVGFMQPLSLANALAFWRGVADGAARGDRALLVAEDATGIVGTVQVGLAVPENQRHRGDLMKMLVHRRVRRRGMGAMLMRAAEDVAVASGRTLLVLDTASADAERLYERMGWQRCGTIPDFASMPDGRLCGTTFFYRGWSTVGRR